LVRLAKWWKVSADEFIDRTAFTIALHDFGKLNQEWQKKIGRRPDEPPLAHSGDESIHGKLPPHATISAYCVTNLFVTRWGRKVSEPLLCAIAHHHSIGATNLPAFELVGEWSEVSKELFAFYPKLMTLWDEQQVDSLSILKSPTELQPKEIDLTDGRAWRTYTILSRILRLSDQMATGGSEYVLLCDENWLTDV
jgi:CRISPR-associated endonuclease/helicase Cas3